MAPILVLFGLVVSGRFSALRAALTALLLSLFVAVAVFAIGSDTLGVAIAKGSWTGFWILGVIWPALLLYHIAAQAGLSEIGEPLSRTMPNQIANILIVAWILPSFVQGIAGFGTPIALTAPLLLAMGVDPVRSLALPLVGYHWSVTFGSMGSSFFVARLTGNLSDSQAQEFALAAALMLGVNAVLSGVLVVLMFGGVDALREAWRIVIAVGMTMAAVLISMSLLEPSIASVSAGASGLLMMAIIRAFMVRAGAVGMSDWAWLRVLAPYGILILLVLPVMLIPASRGFVRSQLLIAPSFPETTTGFGVVNPAQEQFSPIGLVSHPGAFVLVATLFGLLLYRRHRMIDLSAAKIVLPKWWQQSRRVSIPVVLLTVMAAIMVDAGMVAMIADGVVQVTGPAYPLAAPLLGAMGSFASGSTTTSNALLSALQVEAAALLEIEPTVLLAAQTAGGNVGNSLGPMVILVGAGAIGATGHVSDITRRVLGPAMILMVSVVISTAVLSWV